jgi:hypothetical protein
MLAYDSYVKYISAAEFRHKFYDESVPTNK